MNFFKHRLLFLILIFCFLSSKTFAQPIPTPKSDMEFSSLRGIVVQEGGRRKPLDTFARETVRTVTGHEKFQGFGPLELLLSWLTESKQWEETPFLEFRYQPLKDHLKLQGNEGKIAPLTLMKSTDFQLLIQTVQAKQEEKGELSELEKEALALMQRVNLFYGVASGDSLKVISRTSGGWRSLGSLAEQYPNLESIQAAPSLEAKIAGSTQALLSAYHNNDTALFNQMADLLNQSLRAYGEAQGQYLDATSIKREINLNRIKPFRIAWIIYALAFFVLLFSAWSRGNKLYISGMCLLLAAFSIHLYGFILRILISGRAPVTNMYETVIWVSFGAVLFSIIFEAVFRARYYAIAASALAGLMLILADSAPGILDPSIHPLVPVLRSNYWLTIHVLTITLSYAAFALALGIGHISMGYYLFKPQAKEKISRLNYFIYRAIQVGVVLLAAGTILGGVWANASWGRFWGWDPKEVWALIALLGYLAILHGRYAGWVRGFGLAVGSILAFLLVVMAWYGVNFILGVGLHSYGFSSGGAKFMSIFVAVEFIWIVLATLRYKRFETA